MDPFIGEISMFAGNFAPRGWALCNGQLLAISANTALFSILGTTYGGDGRTTFALPDLRGRAPIHEGTGPGLTPRILGQRSGTETTTLTLNNLAPHTHAASAVGADVPVTITGSASIDIKTNSAQGTEESADGNYLAAGPNVGKSPITPYSTTEDGTTMATQTGAIAGMGTVNLSNGLHVTVGNTGAGTPFNNMQPWLAINYIIALVGIFPSRG